MDITRINPGAAARPPEAGSDRAAALAEARQRSGEAALQSAAEARSRQAELIEQARTIVSKAVGADTRLSIESGLRTGIYVYRAINIDTGEIVGEWPPQQFAALLNAAEPGAGDRLVGLAVDNEA